jgi:hypothetical protein
LLGRAAAEALRAAVAERARRWAAAVAPGRSSEAATLGEAVAALRGDGGPVLLAAPDVPGLDDRLALAALDDLAAGCDVAVGVAHDARPYLVAVPRLEPAVLELVEASFVGGVLAALAGRELTVGLLRSERRLVSAADARALALDPRAPAELAGLVRGRLRDAPRR